VREESLEWDWGRTAPAKARGSVLARATAEAKMVVECILMVRFWGKTVEAM
jgi:hypothetical protein